MWVGPRNYGLLTLLVLNNNRFPQILLFQYCNNWCSAECMCSLAKLSLYCNREAKQNPFALFKYIIFRLVYTLCLRLSDVLLALLNTQREQQGI